jgi:hypothetical protein
METVNSARRDFLLQIGGAADRITALAKRGELAAQANHAT